MALQSQTPSAADSEELLSPPASLYDRERRTMSHCKYVADCLHVTTRLISHIPVMPEGLHVYINSGRVWTSSSLMEGDRNQNKALLLRHDTVDAINVLPQPVDRWPGWLWRRKLCSLRVETGPGLWRAWRMTAWVPNEASLQLWRHSSLHMRGSRRVPAHTSLTLVHQ